MPTYTAIVKCPAEAAFDYHAEYERHPEWQPELVSARIVTPGPVGVGSQGIEVRKVGPRRIEYRYEITEHDRPHVTAFRTLEGPADSRGRVTFEAVPEGTRIIFEAELGLRGAARVAAPLANAMFGRAVARHIENFRSNLEDRFG